MSTHAEDHKLTAREASHDVARIVRLVVIVALIAALVAVALDNTGDVRFGYVIGDTSAPIWLLIVVSAVGGAIVGWLIRHRPRRD
jgi:uncharacterized integral membrane protein